MKDLVEAAVEAARAAGEVLVNGFGRYHAVERKGPINFVTEVDRESEEVICRLLGGRFPHHDFLAEERGARGERASGYRWIIDPLDGTTNFVRGLERFAVSIGLEHAGERIVGVVYAPLLDELNVAERGGGAFLLKEAPGGGLSGGAHRLTVSGTEQLLGALVATGFPYEPAPDTSNREEVAAVLGRARDFRRFGSAALDLADVARGRFDGYWEGSLGAWDVAAGVLLVEEAGGRVTGRDGGPFVLAEGYVVATNGLIHEELLSVLADA
jgi:myo-inositol-1(or 4)-monophosphatase